MTYRRSYHPCINQRLWISHYRACPNMVRVYRYVRMRAIRVHWKCIMRVYESVSWECMKVYHESVWKCIMRVYESVSWECMKVYHESVWKCIMRVYESVSWECMKVYHESVWKCTSVWKCIMRVYESVWECMKVYHESVWKYIMRMYESV